MMIMSSWAAIAPDLCNFIAMYFDRFDIVEAYYLWLCDNHEGQWSPSYERLCRIERYFRPGLSLSYETLSDNGRAIYDNIRTI